MEANSTSDGADPTRQAAGGRLGTFAGVFTPSILTILGIILFLRFGYVIGQAGLARAMLILGIATAISVVTSISLAAVATNLRVKGGGDYYLISRTLGPGFGGALGAVLFLAQAASVAFYCVGFAEAVNQIAGWENPWAGRLTGMGAVAALFVFAWLGADWATRFQFVVMAVLIAALISFFLGTTTEWDASRLRENVWRGNSIPFWSLFAIFFPAVTGFTQGVSMSGDLKDPGKSLPRGTFWAVGISTVVYGAVAIALAGSLTLDELASDTRAMHHVARWGWLISAGVIAATLSSAMASFLGAPRILQSMARDRIFGMLSGFAKGEGPHGNPRRAVLLTGAIALAVVAIGGLNAIAAVISMFFLISYGLLNYATYFEARASSPSFRPTFRGFHARFSLIGAIGCLGAMAAINLPAGLVACAILYAVFQYLKNRAQLVGFYDSRRANAFQRVREHLHEMAREPDRPRDWRPQLLVFSDDEHRRERLLRFAAWIEGGSGMTTAVRIVEGRGAVARKQADEAEKLLQKHIHDCGVRAFALSVVAPDLTSGYHVLLQSHGIGPVAANTILLNWLDYPDDAAGLARYATNLRDALRYGKNVIVLCGSKDQWQRVAKLPPEQRRIDVWWTSASSSPLMLLLAHLMTRRDPWEDATIRVLAASNGDRDASLSAMKEMLEDARVAAQIEVVPDYEAATIAAKSADAAVVFLPFHFKADLPVGPGGLKLPPLVKQLPVTALCAAAQDIQLDADPEDGAREQMEAAQAVERAQHRLESAERAAADAVKQSHELQKKMEQAVTSGAGLDQVAEAVAVAAQADEEASDKTRRALKAAAKVEVAQHEASELGVPPPNPKPPGE